MGQTLNVPNRVTGAANNASTFKPYDPAKVVGDTTPTLNSPPPPPQKKGCGGLGALIMVAVAVVATIYTAGALSGAAGSYSGGFMGTLKAGVGALGSTGAGAAGLATSALGTTGGLAVAGAVGSFASQVAGNVLGIQEGFNWKGVAMSALSGGVTAKLGQVAAFKEATTGTLIARAATANALTQGVAVITGLQDKFDWRGVAASAVGAGVGQAVGNAVGGTVGQTDWNPFAKELVTRSASGFAGGLTTAVMRGGKVSVQQIAVDAFGNALGYSLAGNSATATTGDFARMDGQGYRGEAYNGTNNDGAAGISATWADDVAARRFATNPLRLPTVGRTTAAIGADADNINGLDLPADYALQSSNPSDVARGDRLLRQQVNAEIDAGQVSAVRPNAKSWLPDSPELGSKSQYEQRAAQRADFAQQMKAYADSSAQAGNGSTARQYRQMAAGYEAARQADLETARSITTYTKPMWEGANPPELKLDASWSHMGMNSSGIPAARSASLPSFTVQVGFGANAGGGLIGGYVETGVALGLSSSRITLNLYKIEGVVLGPQEGGSIGVVGAISQGMPSPGVNKYYGATAFGNAGLGGNVTVLSDPGGNLGIGRASARFSVGQAAGAGSIQLMQTNYDIFNLYQGKR